MQKQVGWVLAGIALVVLIGARVVTEPDRLPGTIPRATAPTARDSHATPPLSGSPASAPPQDASWMGSVQENIRKAECNVTWQDTCAVPGEPGGLHAANRANNLRAYFREDGVQIVERETNNPDWDLHWQFTGWGRVTLPRDLNDSNCDAVGRVALPRDLNDSDCDSIGREGHASA